MSDPRPFHRFRPHPWHGLWPGPRPPEVVSAYVELTPFDHVKYEIDKDTGYLKVDRPQRTSAQPPSLYGFVPRTYCGDRVGALMPDALRGDGDPLDICVISERPIAHPEVLLEAEVIGGLPMLDGDEADDKIVAVLRGDFVYGGARDVAELPPVLVERLRHYFSTYKLAPDPTPPPGAAPVRVGPAYGREHALAVVRAAIADYAARYGSGGDGSGGDALSSSPAP